MVAKGKKLYIYPGKYEGQECGPLMPRNPTPTP